jgi:hypothetical protein
MRWQGNRWQCPREFECRWLGMQWKWHHSRTPREIWGTDLRSRLMCGSSQTAFPDSSLELVLRKLSTPTTSFSATPCAQNMARDRMWFQAPGGNRIMRKEVAIVYRRRRLKAGWQITGSKRQGTILRINAWRRLQSRAPLRSSECIWLVHRVCACAQCCST